MKKAKIILSAVALFAVVGGALAFKATRVPQTVFVKTTATAPCSFETNLIVTTTTNNLRTSYATTPLTTTICPIVRYLTVE